MIQNQLRFNIIIISILFFLHEKNIKNNLEKLFYKFKEYKFKLLDIITYTII